MKRLLLASLTLLIFSMSILIFQISCRQESRAQNIVSGTNKILLTKGPGASKEIWTSDFDGSNQQQINIQMPGGVNILGNPTISPDGQTIFFNGQSSTGSDYSIYKCGIAGGIAIKIIPGTTTTFPLVHQAY